MGAHELKLGSSYVPGGYDDAYYTPPAAPELISPEPQRHMPEMSNQIQDGLQNMTLNHRHHESVASSTAPDYHSEISFDFDGSSNEPEVPRISPFPKLVNHPANVPPSDDEFEETLWNARNLVLDSTDAEMQLAWAADALIYVGIAADNEERIAAAKPSAARSKTPRIEHELREDAMNIVTFLSSQHHPKAEFLRGMWLEWGRYGQREDKKEAFRCYSRAADKGYARAEYRIGMLYESFNDAPKALRHYHRGVDAGDSASCYRLGMMTLRGQHGQQQDWQRAVELIRQSAETADENAAQGAYVYGMLLARQLPQIEVPEANLALDEVKARMYIEKAAFLKFAKAQLKMGSSYELGAMGCDFDPALSIHYYALASKQGEAEADMALSKWFLVGYEGLFANNEELSFTYAERAAATGLATAEFALGYFYEIGMFVQVDTKCSMEWYEKAAQHGNADAKGRIDALSKRQYVSKKDLEKVALTRIKSMHNSMQDGRPQRRPGPGARLDPLAESGPQAQTQAYPPRASSTVPYPVEARPQPSAGVRSSSTTPYPMHDGPPPVPYLAAPGGRQWASTQPQRHATTSYVDQRPQPQQQQSRLPYGGPAPPSVQHDRRYASGPALGMSPRPDAHSGMGRQGAMQSPRPDAYPGLGRQGAMQSPRPDAHPGPGRQVHMQSPRPDTYPAPGRQGIAQSPRPDAYPVPGRQGSAQRIVSTPANMQQSQYPPQPSPRPGQHHPSAPGTPFQSTQPQIPRPDIGFSAPYEDRRQRPAPQGPPHGRPIQSGRPPQASLQQSQSAPSMGQAKAATMQQGGNAAPRPPAKDSAPLPRPSKGPTTFEEMGVHAKKNGEDCVVM